MGRKLNRVRVVLLLALVMVSASACSTLRQGAARVGKMLHIVQDPGAKLPSHAPDDYRQSAALLEQQKYEKALSGFEAYLLREPASPWTQVAVFNSGRALEGLGRWSEAKERYQAVVGNTGEAPRLQALALFRLSFCYEALGEDQLVVASLHDLLSRLNHLPPEVGRAELPARLAAAYARVGNFDKADLFYRQSESGIARLRFELKDKNIPEWLPRTLFTMGSLSIRSVTWEDFETVIRPLARAQAYLVQAAEVGAKPWSDLSVEELNAIYRNLWNAIERAPTPSLSDPVVAKRQVQLKQWDRAVLLLVSLQELRAAILPPDQGYNEQVTRIVAFADDLEKRLNGLLAERPAGEGLTSDSLQRRQRVRGQVIAPDQSLEMKFLKGARGVREKTTSKEEDPNL